ncbi:MAG: HAMP domain-containing sensor histidine kinase [Desulfobacterales bacterium]|jgi:signal transduction histidine kinase
MSHPHQQDQEVQAAADSPDQFFRELEIQFLIHELKDPIAIIETGLRTLLEKREKFGPLSPKQENTLKRTLRNTKKTRSMLNNLLEIGRSQSGCFVCSYFEPAKSLFQIMKDALEITTGPLAEEIGKYQTAKDAGELLSQNGILLNTSPQAVGIEMFQDETKFSQIVGNLLKNALHHRRTRVEIQMVVEDKNLVLRISDDGPGVDPAHQELIFKRYAQVKECSIVPRKGHGLGLAGALILARCLGGDINIDSQKGHGAAFRLTLPLKMESD